MKRAAGFTLIELVIVIVILGILGAVAAPRFLNLQGDAYEANVNALKGSIQSAMTLANTKAVLDGYDKSGTTADPVDGKDELDDVKFVKGFPAASANGILAMLQDDNSFSDDASADTSYIYAVDGATITVAPRGRGLNVSCEVEYEDATADGVAKVKATVTGC